MIKRFIIMKTFSCLFPMEASSLDLSYTFRSTLHIFVRPGALLRNPRGGRFQHALCHSFAGKSLMDIPMSVQLLLAWPDSAAFFNSLITYLGLYPSTLTLRFTRDTDLISSQLGIFSQEQKVSLNKGAF